MHVPCSLPMVALLPHLRPGMKSQGGLWVGEMGDRPTLAYFDLETCEVVVLSTAAKLKDR